MKKILIATNIVFLAIIVFQACNRPSRLDRDCSNAFCKDYSSAPWVGVIDYNTAVTLAERYRADDGKNFIGDGHTITTVHDARRVWYNLDSLKKFLWEIDSNACHYNCHDTLGVHIYFAKYPDADQCVTLHLNPAYANHHTMFMIPTYWDSESGRNIDFDPSKGCRGRLTPKGRLFLFGGGTTDNIDGQNHGNLAPPPDADDAGVFPSN